MPLDYPSEEMLSDIYIYWTNSYLEDQDFISKTCDQHDMMNKI